MDCFAFMVDQMFADPNLTTEADYQSVAGWGKSVRIIFRQPDQISDFGDVKAIIPAHQADISTAQIESAQEQDRLQITGRNYVVKQAQQDNLGLIWNLLLREDK